VLIHRYLARALLRTLGIVAPALCILVALLQGMRLLPLVAAAGLAPSDLAAVGAALLVPLSAVALPAAAVISVLVVSARLEADGELLALRAAGAGPLRIAAAPAAVCLVVALGAGALSAFVEPAAARGLRERVGGLLVRAAVGRIRDGVVVDAAPGLTVRAARRRGARLDGVFVEDRRREPAAQLFAATAHIVPARDRAALGLRLDDGELHGRTADGRRIWASFGRLETSVPLPAAEEALAAVVPRRLERDLAGLAADARAGEPAAAFLLHRRLALAPGAFALCLLAVLLGTSGRVAARPWAVAAGAALVLAFHLAARLAEALVEAGAASPAAGGWLPAVLGWAAVGATLLLRSAPRLCSSKKRRGFPTRPSLGGPS
jgi:lipopolysaccharide export system permease protein